MTHEELRKLAEAATPGPWEWLSFTSRNSYFPIMAENQKIMVCDVGFGKAEKAAANSAYIAATDPKQVIALLDEIVQIRAELEQSKRDAERYQFLRFADLDGMAEKYWANGIVPAGANFDEAIDAAMSAEKGE